ncbi:hypothetical protein A3752_03410 [Oleiphilus sp. HI0081]|uniref:hypothetical protein n=2 Tax=Oleiphilus TaxID=141450 RepID=UPI0007C3902D|nr:MULTISPECIES: hypothetical protein [unclassified Oleiphilus]KZY76376.1 hypothetical protein A3740_00210 [Oleiphilus sp. HI0068]KZY81198.1 hypothetical protein A3741_17640 [Oleiphilus sp. HI0069]KZY88680.1 hypothetical protein A3743_10985 [Oleiphilus sp. HI0072]KZZ29041.1 hypothetical protein A3752_03410 [Oleiphilus sp. HI0081]KZY29534.1 hypothetical protein A3729_12125 [Oleiphilus sp. HI0043]
MDSYRGAHFLAGSGPSFVTVAKSLYRRRYPNVVVQGDSWFDYPGRQKHFFYGPNNLHQALMQIIPTGANWWDSSVSMATAKQVSRESSVFRYAKYNRVRLDVYCLSMGGNDLFAGLKFILKDYDDKNQSPSECFNSGKERLLQNIRDDYHKVLRDRDRYLPSVPVLAHCYASPDQRQRGFKLAFLKAGPWIKTAFDAKAYPPMLTSNIDNCIRRRAIRYLHAQLSETIIGAMGQYQNTLSYDAFGRGVDLSAAKYWDDEIHLSPKGWIMYAKDMQEYMIENGLDIRALKRR